MNLLVSFSGGRSSGMMCDIVKKQYKNINKTFIFANTGQEHEKTLEFVDKCDKHFNLNLVWVEAVFDKEKGKGTKHKVVDFKTACRDGFLFDEMCKKYGLPNADFPHCTRELKLQPIASYMRSIGTKQYHAAIGLRADEYRRVSDKAVENRIVYPLIDNFIVKDSVLSFWEEMPFDLGLKDFQGNCLWCWKKSDRKLHGVYQENKSYFDVPMALEKHKGSGVVYSEKPERKIFRGERNTQDLIDSFAKFETGQQCLFDTDYGNCGESCEIYKM